MRLSSLAQKIKTRPEAARQELHDFSFPAPVGGWNARDPLIGMKITDAVVLDNYFPTTSNVQLRKGSASYATGLGNKVETLLTFSSGATNKMFGIAGASIFDVSAAGAVGAAVMAGLSNARWQYRNFTTSGGSYLLAVNGTDSLVNYDGINWQAVTAVSAPYAITGVTSANLSNLFIFKKRVFFIEKNKLKLWYLAVDSFQGAATAFDISAQFKRGGYVMAGGSLTRDGGDGIDDLFVVISNTGEVVIYQGTDPGTDFVLVGRYDIGAPIGRRCFMDFGADLVVLTLDGAVALSKILTLDTGEQGTYAITEKIRNAFNGSAKLYKDNFGWEAISYPGGSRLIFNIPVNAGVQQHQYVQNTVTGRWCRFLELNANCWALYNNLAYFGGNDGLVHLSDTGYSDNGEAIMGHIQTANSYIDKTFYQKHIKMARANLISDPLLTYNIAVITNFNNDHSLMIDIFNSKTGGSRWDTAIWDVSPWGDVSRPLSNWQTVEGLGSVIALTFMTSTINTPVELNSIDTMYTRGGAV